MHEQKEGTHRSDEQEGRYTNYFKIGFNKHEFVLDFGQAYQGGASELHQTRLITGPVYAKVLAQMLLAAIRKYEKKYERVRRPGKSRPDRSVKDGAP